MVGSNERGRAFEFAVRRRLLAYAVKKRVEESETERSKARDEIEGKYFLALGSATQDDFILGAKAFVKWIDAQGWLDGATKMALDRVPDNEAKENIEMTDIRLRIQKPGGIETRDISVKHHHHALCHPRLPSLAQQCGYEKGCIEDKAYRESYKKIWNAFHKKVKALGKKVKTYSGLEKLGKDYRKQWLYAPLQKNAVDFLRNHANIPKHAITFFRYLVGKNDYIVLENEPNHIEVKHFTGIQGPTGFEITYPYEGRGSTFLIEFSNGWKIAIRLHTASGRIEKNGTVFMTEKEDPICQNLEDVIKIEEVPKRAI